MALVYHHQGTGGAQRLKIPAGQALECGNCHALANFEALWSSAADLFEGHLKGLLDAVLPLNQ